MNMQHSITDDATREVHATIRLLEGELGRYLVASAPRNTTYQTADHSLLLYLLFSKYHPSKDWYFYGVKISDVERPLKPGATFVVFILGDHSKLAVVPMWRLQRAIHMVERPYRSGDDYKFNIKASSLDFMKYPLSAQPFLNQFDQLR